MQKQQIEKFLEKLLEYYLIYAPVKDGRDIVVKKITAVQEIDWSGKIPKNSFKNIFLLPQEDLLVYQDNQVLEPKKTKQKIIVWGMNLLDLEACGLYELVFAKDPYYLERRRNICVAGFSAGIESDYRKYKIFHEKYEENILEHRSFDLFIEQQKNHNLKVFSGSQKGQRILEKYDLSDYENIEFAGFIPEQGPDPRLQKLYEKVKNSFDKKVWDELGQRCLACGRCSIVCPTCFCYDLSDVPQKDKVIKRRQQGSCFYNDFSKIAKDTEYLDTIKKKIFFWYFHKFVRIPDEYKYTGCVSCMRCYQECPVDINIKKVLSQL